ncbi:anti-sigma factor antagonist [Streptomyces sp. NPDC051207]|uniref:anti-sigma factor antagonist n=1 Tax=Streptomyces sp. NPDC051207 TaxID=3154641 RepID=UPI0034319159
MNKADHTDPADANRCVRGLTGNHHAICAAFDSSMLIAQARTLARTFLHRLAAHHGLPITADASDTVELIVSELVTNARKYAPGPCLLTLKATDSHVTVAVRDEQSAPPVIHTANAGRTGQHGLELVLALSQHFCVHRNAKGKYVTATVTLGDTSRPARHAPTYSRQAAPPGLADLTSPLMPSGRSAGSASGASIQINGSGRCVVARITGAMDHQSQTWLVHCISQLITDSNRPVILDLTDVSFCDSVGLSILLRTSRDAAERGTALALAHVPAVLSQRLTMTGADQVLHVHDTVAQAETASLRTDAEAQRSAPQSSSSGSETQLPAGPG